MSENGPVLPPEVYRRRRIVAVVALLAVILLLVAGVTSIVGMINNKKDATVASTATATGAPFQSFSARPSENGLGKHLRLGKSFCLPERDDDQECLP